MKLWTGVKEAFIATTNEQNSADIQQPPQAPLQGDVATNIEKGPAEGETFSDNIQAGVQKVEAAAMVWTKKDLIAAYGLMWFIFVVASLQEVVVRVLTPFVTSTFQTHSLTATMNVVSGIVGGLVKIPLAKILDTWGRPQGMTFMLVLWVLGFVLMAACKNVTTYAAALVFYTVGAQGLSYCVTVFVSDTTSLKNRSLMLSFASSPYIFTTWSGGPIAAAALSGAGWRWGLGVWAIVTPAVVLPFCGIFFWNQHKAKRLGLIEDAVTLGDLSLPSIWKYCIDVDLLGIFILAAGMTLFLLPMNIYSMQEDGWKSPMIISMIIIGGLLIIAFVFYERFLAPVTFIPYDLLVDRNMLFGGTMFLFLFFSSGVWQSYFSSMIMVVWNQGVANTTYINNIYRTGSSVFAIIIGLLIRWTGRYKPFALYFFMPLMMLGVGLMIHFRQPDQDIGYIVMTQIFVAFAGGPVVECGQMCMMAVADHQHIAVSLAVLSLFGSVGGAIGSTVSAAIWTGTFKKALERHVPKTVNVEMVYSSLYAQLSYPPGTPERLGIAKAYGDAQRIMCITSVGVLAGGLLSIGLWRNLNVNTIKQTRGNII
ncbi:major facilitator MirA [Fusarium fujikuroi]|nr:major facilitator MirA [Fusarium fujikuroi]SCV57471.1 related to major facilitator MirA [Fusarium fujikuroi]